MSPKGARGEMSIGGIAGLITGVAAALLVVWKVIVWGQRIVEGLRCQLRTDMLEVYYRHKDEKEIRQYELENFLKNYQAYKALHGNSFIDTVAAEVKSWQINT